MCIWSKIRAILGWSKFVSAYVKRDKKILKKWILGVWVPTILIEGVNEWMSRCVDEGVEHFWFDGLGGFGYFGVR